MYTSAALLTSARGSTTCGGVVEVVEVDVAAVAAMVQVQVEAEVRARRGRRRAHRLGR